MKARKQTLLMMIALMLTMEMVSCAHKPNENSIDGKKEDTIIEKPSTKKNAPVVGTLTLYYAKEDLNLGDSGFGKGTLICDSNDPFARIVEQDDQNYKYETWYMDMLNSWLLPKTKVEKRTYPMSQLSVENVGDMAIFLANNGDVARIFWSKINGHKYYNYDGSEENWRETERLSESYVLSINGNGHWLFEEQLEERQGYIRLYTENKKSDGPIGIIEERWINNEKWGNAKSAYSEDGKLLVDQWMNSYIPEYVSIAYIGDLDALYIDGTFYYRETNTRSPITQEPPETVVTIDEEDEMIMPMEQAPTYYNFVGDIAKSDVHMSLELDHTNVKGLIYYDQYGKLDSNKAMKIYGDATGHHTVLNVFYKGKPAGTFDGEWEDDKYQGTFTNAKNGKSFSFHLTKVYSDIVPGGGEAFYEEFDDFDFEIPNFEQTSVPQEQMAEQQRTQNKQQKVQDQAKTQQLEQYGTSIMQILAQLSNEKSIEDYVDEHTINYSDFLDEFRNIIKAEKKYTPGTEMILRIRADKIEKEGKGYSYKISHNGTPAYIYSNDASFVDLDYPQIVWVVVKFKARNEVWGRSYYEFIDGKLIGAAKPTVWELY